MYPITIIVRGSHFVHTYHANNKFEHEVIELMTMCKGFELETETGNWNPETYPNWRLSGTSQLKLIEARLCLRLDIIEIIQILALRSI